MHGECTEADAAAVTLLSVGVEIMLDLFCVSSKCAI